MAPAAGFPCYPTPPAFQASDAPEVRKQWEAEFSRFFFFSQRQSPAAAPLRPLSKSSMLRFGKGIWITASLPATILIFKDSCSSDAVFTVSVSGYIHEEHLLTSLRVSWPRVACVSQCPIRGSRAFFFSYKDCSNQIQKFAVRFPTYPVAASFFNFLQDCSRDTMDIAPPASVFVCDSSSPSEMFSSNVVQSRLDEGQSHEEAITMQMPSPAFGGDQSNSSLPPLASNINTKISELPPSFTELLTNCSNQMAIEPSMQREKANHEPRSGQNVPNPSPQNVTEQLVTLEDVKNQVERYMTDASFLDMMFKVEKVIHELGGDLTL